MPDVCRGLGYESNLPVHRLTKNQRTIGRKTNLAQRVPQNAEDAEVPDFKFQRKGQSPTAKNVIETPESSPSDAQSVLQVAHLKVMVGQFRP